MNASKQGKMTWHGRAIRLWHRTEIDRAGYQRPYAGEEAVWLFGADTHAWDVGGCRDCLFMIHGRADERGKNGKMSK